MATELLTDARAADLLVLLRDYARDALARGETIGDVLGLRFAELAGDLIDSLPRELVPSDVAFIAGDSFRRV